MITALNFILSFLEMLMIFSAIVSIPITVAVLAYLLKDTFDLFIRKISEIAEKLLNK